MTDLQRDYYKMFLLVYTILDSNKGIWQGQGQVSGCVAQLNQDILDLRDLSSILTLDNSGIFKTLKEHRGELTTNGFYLKEALRWHFANAGKEEEKRLFNYPITHLKKLRKGDFYLALLKISENATSFAAPIIQLGATQAQITKLAADVIKYYNLLLQIDKDKETKKAAVAATAPLIRKTRLMLKEELDRYINIYSTTQPGFVTAYKHSRKLVRSGGKRNYYTVIINGTVTDAATKKALPNVNIVSETKGKTAVSNESGKFSIKLYKKDAKALKLSLEGFETLNIALPAKFKDHKMDMKMAMKKSNEKTENE